MFRRLRQKMCRVESTLKKESNVTLDIDSRSTIVCPSDSGYARSTFSPLKLVTKVLLSDKLLGFSLNLSIYLHVGQESVLAHNPTLPVLH